VSALQRDSADVVVETRGVETTGLVLHRDGIEEGVLC